MCIFFELGGIYLLF